MVSLHVALFIGVVLELRAMVYAREGGVYEDTRFYDRGNARRRLHLHRGSGSDVTISHRLLRTSTLSLSDF